MPSANVTVAIGSRTVAKGEEQVLVGVEALSQGSFVLVLCWRESVFSDSVVSRGYRLEFLSRS